MATNKQSNNFRFRLGFTIFMLILCSIGLISLAFEGGRGHITNQSFINLYTIIWSVGWLGAAFSFFWLYKVRGESVYADDSSPIGQLNLPWLRWGIWILICVMVVISVSGVGKSLLPLPNAYAEGDLTIEELSLHSNLQNVKNIGFYPMMEEAVVFVLVWILIWIFQFLISMGFKINYEKVDRNPVIKFFVSIPAVIAGSLFFMSAHALSYGQDSQAYISAFVFESVVQMANVHTGLFLSWLPHFINNTMVVLVKGIGLVIGGAFI